MTNAAPQVRYWIPEGCVTEEGLRADVRSLARRGFGAIELVSLNFFDTPMPDDARWGTSQYYKAVRVVLNETSRLGLAVDIANGPGWPISSPRIVSADDPATLYELTYGVTEVEATDANGSTPLPKRRMAHDEGTPLLVSVCAYRLVGKKLLDETSYVDLTSLVDDGKICWTPDEGSGTWAVFAFWGQPACHKVLDRFYVVDHLSREGAEVSVTWWQDDLLPALGDEAVHLRSFFCDSLEYKVTMEWTRGFIATFEGRHGYPILPYLPVVGEPATFPTNDVPGYAFSDEVLTRVVRRDYAETCSWLYTHEHLQTLCAGARQLGKTVRYQVAYNKPFCEEDAAAAVDIPENESLGRPTLDNLRVMAGAAHLARKPRYSLEAAAEFGSGYGQTQRDMLWWIKRAAIAGCNAQVFHGASYCGHGVDGISWPGWEAWNRLCSNNWNRTLSERSLNCMNAAVARLNELRRNRALVDLAFYREEYLNNGHGGDGDHYVRDGGLLNDHGYTYEFLSPGLLSHENATVRDGRLDPNGCAYKALVVAEQVGMTRTGMERVTELAAEGLPVFLVGKGELAPLSMADLEDLAAWEEARDRLIVIGHLVDDYDGLLTAMAATGILPDARYRTGHMLCAHIRRDDEDLYLLYNGNRTGADEQRKIRQDTIMPAILRDNAFQPAELDVELAGHGNPYLYDLTSGMEYALEGETTSRGVRLQLPVKGDHMMVVGLRDDVTDLPRRSMRSMQETELHCQSLTLYELRESSSPLDLFAGGFAEVACVESLTTPSVFSKVPCYPEHFAGYGEYRWTFDLADMPSEARLRLPSWNDGIELEMNEIFVPVAAGFGDEVDVCSALRKGKNELVIRVFSNLSNKLDKEACQHYGMSNSPVLLQR